MMTHVTAYAAWCRLQTRDRFAPPWIDLSPVTRTNAVLAAAACTRAMLRAGFREPAVVLERKHMLLAAGTRAHRQGPDVQGPGSRVRCYRCGLTRVVLGACAALLQGWADQMATTRRLRSSNNLRSMRLQRTKCPHPDTHMHARAPPPDTECWLLMLARTLAAGLTCTRSPAKLTCGGATLGAFAMTSASSCQCSLQRSQ